jgi:hypothetical protein
VNLLTWPSLRTPSRMHCEDGFWTGNRFLSREKAMARYAGRKDGFDETSEIQNDEILEKAWLWWDKDIPSGRPDALISGVTEPKGADS